MEQIPRIRELHAVVVGFDVGVAAAMCQVDIIQVRAKFGKPLFLCFSGLLLDEMEHR